MKRCLLLLAVLAAASSLSAQEGQNYTREEVLAVFAQYNPSVLEKAKTNEQYNDVLEKFVSAYQEAKTEQSQAELIAVAKNFDNSLRLFLISTAYEQGFLLQKTSNIGLEALDTNTQADLLKVFEGIFANTLDVKEEEVKLAKARIKAFKKDKTLGAEARKLEIARQQELIKSLKAEIKELKKNAQEKIKAASNVYFADLKSTQEANLKTAAEEAQKKAAAVKQTPNLQVKSKNKKPVAK